MYSHHYLQKVNPYEDFVNLGYMFKFLCDNGDGGHEIKIAMRDLGGLVEALKFVAGLMVYQYAVIVYFYFSIGRLESVKQALYELVILPLRKPELFSHEKLLGPQKGVLLYGPPGTRKTMLAKAIIREFGAVFITMRISNLMNKWFGDAQKLGHPIPQAAICTLFPRLCLGMLAIP
ncbi:MSP1 family protein [Populus alba x Populus x berolinensis]|nr:MSP1 family protein [Populus alba x Populus x berolinensis]